MYRDNALRSSLYWSRGPPLRGQRCNPFGVTDSIRSCGIRHAALLWRHHLDRPPWLQWFLVAILRYKLDKGEAPGALIHNLLARNIRS